MPSKPPHLEYDIFISYRHNDNKSDGWVTEFVKNLREELLATVKRPVTVYFDQNPHDGLQDSHLVEDSLNSKLRSLLFIPIVSQTYCDENSYAWKQEFLPFLELSEKDPTGSRITLHNGNVVSRVLPVKIHELDPLDTRLLESNLQGFLRSIDFIYQEKGVNRPLREKDDEFLRGSYQVLYRNQINKVANAVRDIILAVERPQHTREDVPSAPTENISAAAASSGPETASPSGQKVPTVFLAWPSADLKAKREEMALTLQKAGLNVLPSTDCPADEESFKQAVQENLAQADCSLHILSGEYGRRFELDDEVSFPRYQYELAAEKAAGANGGFQVFIWHLPNFSPAIKPVQQEFINHIRMNISRFMMFSNAEGAFQLIDDIRSAITVRITTETIDTRDTDIFFIYCEDDELEAVSVTDSISEEVPIEILNILSESEDEYKELSRQQILKSKLGVVYFKNGADWALPFIKHVWKSVGGAGSPTPLLLVGEDDPKTNLARKFKAPKVFCSIVPKDQVPEKVKETYKKLNAV